MAAYSSPAFAQELPTTGSVETRLGKLELTDGYPTEATAKKLYATSTFSAPAKRTFGRYRQLGFTGCTSRN